MFDTPSDNQFRVASQRTQQCIATSNKERWHLTWYITRFSDDWRLQDLSVQHNSFFSKRVYFAQKTQLKCCTIARFLTAFFGHFNSACFAAKNTGLLPIVSDLNTLAHTLDTSLDIALSKMSRIVWIFSELKKGQLGTAGVSYNSTAYR